MLENGMAPERVAITLLVGVALLSSSCFMVRVPVETAGTVVTSTAKVAEKTATTSVDLAGKAASKVMDGERPKSSGERLWRMLR